MISIPLKRPGKRANQKRKSHPLIKGGVFVLRDSVIAKYGQKSDEYKSDIHSELLKQLTYQIPYRLC